VPGTDPEWRAQREQGAKKDTEEAQVSTVEDAMGPDALEQLEKWKDEMLASQPLTMSQVEEFRRGLALVKRSRAGRGFEDEVVRLWPQLGDAHLARVKEPMDLGKIDRRLGQGRYKTFGEFKNDLALIFTNSVDYNGATHKVTAQAFAVVEKVWKECLKTCLTGDKSPHPVSSLRKQDGASSVDQEPERQCDITVEKTTKRRCPSDQPRNVKRTRVTRASGPARAELIRMERSFGDTAFTAPSLAKSFQNDPELVTRAYMLGARDPALTDKTVFWPPSSHLDKIIWFVQGSPVYAKTFALVIDHQNRDEKVLIFVDNPLLSL
jgi:hypothetical protein